MHDPQYLTGEPFPQHELSETPIPQAERPSFAHRREAKPPESPSLLLDYWKLVLRHKWMILLMAFLGALAGLLVALPQTRVYRSQTTLEIQPFNENLLNTRDVDPSASADYYAAETNLPTQLKILQSDTLISRVLTKLQLDQSPEVLNQPGRISVWRRALGLPGPAVSDHAKAVGMASGSLSVRILPLTRIVAISSDSINPQVAANFANTLANEYIEQSIEVRWRSTQRTSDWLTRQLEDVKIRLEKSEDQLQSYAYAAGLMFTGEKKDSVDEERLRQVQEELSKAQVDRFSKQSQLGIAVSGPAEALPPEAFDSERLKSSQDKITDLRRQHAQLRSVFASGHYKVKAVEAEIKELETALANERNDLAQSLHNQYEAALRQETLLQKAYAEQSKRVSHQAVKAVQYNIFKREVDTNRSVYENLLQKVKEYGIASAMQASNIRIVDPAKVPTSPYKPDLAGNTKLGLLAGAFLGVVFAFIRERADRTLQAPGEAPLYLNAREFGVIPSAGSERKQRIYGHASPLLSLQIDSGNGKPPNGHNGRNGHLAECVELVTWQQNPSRLAESFRTTLASILFSTENGNSPRVIVVTSCSPMAGKTTVTTNLGIALAEINRRVLLIDGDLRKPRLHHVFHLQNQRGLTDILLETDPVEEYSRESLVQRTEIPGLHVLGSGTATHNISNLLFSTRLPQLLERFKREFDTVLIDTPPMLGLSDARVLGRLSDGVILVFFARSTSRDAALTAVELFREDHTPVLGTILNHWNPKRNPAQDHYSDYYYQDADKPKANGKSV